MRDRTEDKITLLMIRHGSTASNLKRKYLGKTDERLCQEGIDELEELRDKVSHFETQVIFSSPMKRCLQSEKILFRKEPVIIDEWTEIDFGEFELKSYDELKDNIYYRKWIDSSGEIKVCGVETRSEFIKRSMKGFEALVKACSDNRYEKAAAVVHGGTIMAVLSSLSKEDYYSFQAGWGAGYIAEIEIRPEVRLIDYKRIG